MERLNFVQTMAAASSAMGERTAISVREAVTRLGISRALGYQAVQNGDIPSIRVGRRILIPTEWLNHLGQRRHTK